MTGISKWPLVHATGVAIGGHGVLLCGASGSGKSDLALRLIDRGASLICDDAVLIENRDSQPILRQAPNIGSKIEIRGIGIIGVAATDSIALRLLVNLGEEGERLPDPWPFHDIAGFSAPALRLDPFQASAPIKIEFAVQYVVDQAMLPRKHP